MLALTLNVFTVKVADAAPANTVTDAGTEATDGLELAKATTTPPGGAAAVSETLPVSVEPPRTDVELNESDASAVAGASGSIASVVAIVMPPWLAEMVALEEDATTEVEIGNVVDEAPASIVADVGIDATPALLLSRAITAPPEGAGPASAIVPVTALPPTTVDGETLTA